MNRHFRRRQPPEQWEMDYTPFGGGLDQTASPLKVKPGRISQSLNFEEVFGAQGYSSIKGYERYSGKASPSAAEYAVQPFDTGTAAIVAGDIVTGASATALVVSVTVTSGSFGGGDAAGYLILTSRTGSWADNEAIQVSAATKALASDITEPGSAGYSDNTVALKAAREALRALIAQPTGSGGILGVAVYKLAVYAVRNNAGGTSATLWKSSAAGWTSIRTGMPADGTYKFEVANFSGDSTEISLFGVSGKGRLFKVDSTGTFTYAEPIYGSESTSDTSLTIGTGAKAFTIIESARDYIAGDAVTAWDRADFGNSMTGTVASYVGTTLTVTVTSVTGSGTIAAWEIGHTNFDDKPYLLAEHKDHMFLGYPLGQLQTSNLGDPMVYTTTAALFGLGDDLTGLTSLKGELLGVFCRKSIKLLQGSSSLDWVLGTHTKDVGAVMDTVQDNAGNAIFLDDKGLTTLQATQDFGSFSSALLSANAQKTINAKRQLIVGTRTAKGSNQYRLYFSDMTMLRCTILTGNPILKPGDVSFTDSTYDTQPTCFAAGAMSDGLEHMFFGTDDGWVMEEDAGTSFDGVAKMHAIRPHFNHFKSVGSNKGFHKLEIEIDCPDPVDLMFRQIMNYDDGEIQHSGDQDISVIAAGGQFDVSTWDTFQFDGPIVSRAEASIDGEGRNMTELIFFESDFVRPVTLQGLLVYFTILELQR